MIRILLADDEALVRQGICGLLRLKPGFSVLEAADGDAALKLILDQRPDVSLLDVRMPPPNGLEVLDRLRSFDPMPRCIVLTTFDDRNILLEAIRLGAQGYLRKDVTLDTLVEAVEAVVSGDTYFHPSLTSSILDGTRGLTRKAPGNDYRPDIPDPLTPRELDVLRLLVGGLSNREIARALSMTEGTAKVHVSNILGKLRVRDRVQALLKALQLRLV